MNRLEVLIQTFLIWPVIVSRHVQNTIGACFEALAGDTPVADALAAL